MEKQTTVLKRPNAYTLSLHDTWPQPPYSQHARTLPAHTRAHIKQDHGVAEEGWAVAGEKLPAADRGAAAAAWWLQMNDERFAECEGRRAAAAVIQDTGSSGGGGGGGDAGGAGGGGWGGSARDDAAAIVVRERDGYTRTVHSR